MRATPEQMSIPLNRLPCIERWGVDKKRSFKWSSHQNLCKTHTVSDWNN